MLIHKTSKAIIIIFFVKKSTENFDANTTHKADFTHKNIINQASFKPHSAIYLRPTEPFNATSINHEDFNIKKAII